jgi:Fic family protein
LAETDFLAIGDSIVRRVEEGASLRRLLRERVKRFHAVLYDGILQTAGRYRRAEDPGGGYVAFGGQQGQKRRPRYRGVPPSDLPAALDDAFRYLSETLTEDDHPIRSAVLFYADFVYAHPFYDANGRIGRLLVSLYLYVHAYYVNWAKLYGKKNKFLRKLNACHNRRDSENRKMYRRYQGYLSDFFERYVKPHDEFYHPGVADEAEGDSLA